MAEYTVVMIVGIIIGLTSLSTQVESHNTIVEKGYGIYCPDNGKFAFTGECNGLQETQLQR
jgi:hypothetical protein